MKRKTPPLAIAAVGSVVLLGMLFPDHTPQWPSGVPPVETHAPYVIPTITRDAPNPNGVQGIAQQIEQSQAATTTGATP